MNSLPLNPEIIRPNKPATIIFYEVLPVAEFANCMYWHDIEDKSLISLGSVKISRVYHSTYKGFTDRTCADDFSLVHFSGAFVSASQIVTVVEFEAERYGCAEIPLGKALFSVFCEEVPSAGIRVMKIHDGINWTPAAEVSCETCADYVASSIKSRKCFTCIKNHVYCPTHHHGGRPEPEHIDDQPKTCFTCGRKRGLRAPIECATCIVLKNWMPK